MGGKHRLEGPARPRRVLVSGAAPISILCAASFTTLAVHPEKPTVPDHVIAVTAPASAPRPVSQEGVLIAVSADSVTARSASGYTQTYLLTPDTTVISDSGCKSHTVASHFTVNDPVDIVGTVQGDRALATSLAHRSIGHGNGPPMDTVAGQ
ncbi:hypothetical protein MSTO_45700 [Mycobacterium stomatepiae]|uniref:Uncharacterized protein n=1 Tax=Mycobacterium stomatepiae TaxID=470076 RepID=A0A7I7QDJ0_9MYCO|nr:hypothetical protein MSTO_45700 [Mycobacterium stomatepiae]